MLWVHGHYIYINSYSAGIVFIRQNLTCRRQILTYEDDPRTEGVSTVSRIKKILEKNAYRYNYVCTRLCKLNIYSTWHIFRTFKKRVKIVFYSLTYKDGRRTERVKS